LATTLQAQDDSPTSPIGLVRSNGVGVHTFGLVSSSRKAALWGASISLAKWLVLNIRDYDVVHLNYVWCFSTIAGCALARLNRIPVILTPHESLTSFDLTVTSRSRSKRMLKRLLRRIVLGSVDRVIVASRLEFKETDTGPVPKDLVPLCLKTPSLLRSRPVMTSTAPNIGFLGRITKKKGIDRLLEAVSLLDSEEWSLSIAGPMESEEDSSRYLKLADDLGIAERVSWLGLIDYAERDAFLERMDVLVMPSDFESFGLVAAEAMYLGTPVIVPRASGVSRLVSESGGGIVVERSEARELADALSQLTEDPAGLRDAGEKGRAAVGREHSYSAFSRSTRRIYADVRAAPRQRGIPHSS